VLVLLLVLMAVEFYISDGVFKIFQGYITMTIRLTLRIDLLSSRREYNIHFISYSQWLNEKALEDCGRQGLSTLFENQYKYKIYQLLHLSCAFGFSLFI